MRSAAKHGGGGKPSSADSVDNSVGLAPTTMLRMVPLPRVAGEERASSSAWFFLMRVLVT